jgi:hypothetical protein
VVVGCVSLALGGWTLWQIGAALDARGWGIAGLLLYPTAPLLTITLSNETTIAVTLVLLAFLAAQRQRLIPASVFAACAILMRADAILIMPLLLWQIALQRTAWRRLIVPLCVGVAILLAWVVFAIGYFGSPLPVTLVAKRLQGQMEISTPFFRGVVDWVQYLWQLPMYWIQLVFIALGVIALVLMRRLRAMTAAIIIVLWSALYYAAYSWLGVSAYFWYYGPLVPGLVALMAFGVFALHHQIARRNSRTADAIALALAIALTLPQWLSTYQLSQQNDARLTIYSQAGDWLYANTPPTTKVGALEVGIIGYHAQRRMIDFAGLLQPDTAQQLGRGKTYEDSARYAFERYQPDYVLLFTGSFSQLRAMPNFAQRCRTTKNLQDAQNNLSLEIFECKWQ